MSEAGGCPRALAASHLGYESIPDTEFSLRVMREGTRHETLVAEDLFEMGLQLEDAHFCERCNAEFGGTRMGHHVEIATPLIRLVGHLDRRVWWKDRAFSVEIKALGRFTFDKFKRHGFDEFYGYACQEACYLEADKCPGLYVVKSRDTGELLKYSIRYNGISLSTPGFTPITLPVTFAEIRDRLHLVELSVRDKELPECTVPADERRFCRFRYLCMEVAEEIVPTASLTEAAELYREGKAQENEAKVKIAEARETFLAHALQHSLKKYSVSGVRISYSGEKTRSYVSEAKLKELVGEDILKQVYQKSKPYHDIRVYVDE